MYSDTWTAKFVKEKLASEHNVKNIVIEKPNIVIVDRDEGPSFTVFCMSLSKIGHDTMIEIADGTEDLIFITNIKKDYVIYGVTLEYLSRKDISFGGFGDLGHFAYKSDNDLYENKNYTFIKNALEHHRAVARHYRPDNNTIAILRKGFEKELTMATTYDYDVSAESIRKARTLSSDFNVLVGMNPYGRITGAAVSAAESMGVEVCMWKEFLGKLNSQWK
jgi:hypothetical protein